MAKDGRDPVVAVRFPSATLTRIEQARHGYGMDRSSFVRWCVERQLWSIPPAESRVHDDPLALAEEADNIAQENARALLARLDWSDPCDD